MMSRGSIMAVNNFANSLKCNCENSENSESIVRPCRRAAGDHRIDGIARDFVSQTLFQRNTQRACFEAGALAWEAPGVAAADASAAIAKMNANGNDACPLRMVPMAHFLKTNDYNA